MYDNDNGSLALLDWEFAGFLATPAIDLATMLIGSLGPDGRQTYESMIVAEFWRTLIDEGVDPQDYPYDRLFHEYVTDGLAH